MGNMTYLLEHAGTLGDLIDNVVVKDGLSEHTQGLVLGVNTEVLCFDVDLDIFQLAHTTRLGFGGADDPAAKLIVGTVATTFALGVLVALIEDELLLEIFRKLFGTSLDCFLGNIDGPDVILDILALIQFLGFGVVVATSFHAHISIFSIGVIGVAVARATMSVTVLLGVAVLFGLGPTSFLLRLVFLALLRLILQDEGAELEATIDSGTLAARFAIQQNVSILEVDVGLGVLALLAKDKFGDEAVKVVLELGSLMRTIDDPAVIVRVVVGLGAKLEAKVFDDI